MYIKSKNIILPVKEKALVLSDLHLGLDGNNFDREIKLLKYLMQYKNMYRYIILNGDVFETWKYGSKKWDTKARVEKIDEIMDKIPGLREFLHRSDVILIHGNHDYVLTKYNNDSRIIVYGEINVYTPNKLYHIEHGNNADPKYNNTYMKKTTSLKTIIFDYVYDKMLSLLERLGYIKDKIKLDSELTDILFTANLLNSKLFEDYAKTFNEFNVVIFGHTHITANKDFGSVRYINTGDQLVNMECCVISDEKDFTITKKY